MPWDDSYRTGHAGIDHQHGYLFKLIDRVAAGDRARQRQAILDLVKYIVEHFSYEERMMSRYDYPEAESHLAEHAALTRDTLRLRQGIEQGTAIAEELRAFLDDWLIRHIASTDRRLAGFLAGRE